VQIARDTLAWQEERGRKERCASHSGGGAALCMTSTGTVCSRPRNTGAKP
jgi:hypothetical protein